MIHDVNPIPNILTVTIKRNRFIVHGVRERKGQEFLRKLARAIIVSTASDNRVKTEGVMRGSDQMFRSSLRGSVGAVRCKRRIFSKVSSLIFGKTAQDLVGGYLKKTPDNALAGDLQQHLAT